MSTPTEKKKPLYKRWWFIVLAIAIIGGVAASMGGGDSADQTADQTASSESTTAQQEIVAGISDVVTSGDFEIVVSGLGERTETIGDEYFQEEAQGEYIPVSLSLTNRGSESAYVSDGDIKLVSGETTYSSDTGAIMYADDAFAFEEINPGNTLSGTLYFDVPAGTEVDSLTFSGGLFDTDAVIKLN
ncbi:DUF4352 domain-containing protein [Ancrocorticia populi]|uniref:DUF4352 domain-containing protein n=1 Tax=Ancrocorticia populi TaxID=2175228 RepID=UPI003F931D62